MYIDEGDLLFEINGKDGDIIMNNFEIFTDSSANIPDGLISAHNIGVIPYTCTVNGKERLCYEKDKQFAETAKRFYDDMRAGADVKTSLVDAERIIKAVEPAMAAGKDAVMVTISSGISGTYHQALEAKKILENKYRGCKFYVCDSANAGLGQGLQVLKVADLRDMGESAASCADWVNENAYKLNSYFTVGDLKYLRKGGRISATLAIAGTILNIKPILKADGGTPAKITFFSKERGRKKALTALADIFRENAVNPETNTVAIAHADCEADALALADMIRDNGANDIIIEYYDVCTGSHVGPGTVALFFYGKDRRSAAAATQKKTNGRTATQKI